MSKALMMWRGGALVNGFETPLFGDNTAGSSESGAQASATEACTISGLRGTIFGGGSGTNTFQFRKNGANGSQVASRAGQGAFEDTTNSDVLAIDDLFNIAYTDTGTDSICWIAANVEFSSGHGNFHGAAASNGGFGATFNNDSATNFLPLAGLLEGDSSAGTEANVQWKNRGYTSWEALQVRVSSNARTSNSTFRNRINGIDGGFEITFGAGVTGLVVDTATPDSLVNGDLLSVSLDMGSGAGENLIVRFVAGTFKSSSNKSEIWCGSASGGSRTASGTATSLQIGGGLYIGTVSEANYRAKVGFAAIVSNLRCYVSANTYTGDCNVRLLQNGSAVITLTIPAGATGWRENSSDTVTIDSDDGLTYEIDDGTANSITIHSVGITFSPSETTASTDISSSGEASVTLAGASIVSGDAFIEGEAFNDDGGGDVEMGGTSLVTMTGASTASGDAFMPGEAEGGLPPGSGLDFGGNSTMEMVSSTIESRFTSFGEGEFVASSVVSAVGDISSSGEALATLNGTSIAEAPITSTGESLVTFGGESNTGQEGRLSSDGESIATLSGESYASGALNSHAFAFDFDFGFSGTGLESGDITSTAEAVATLSGAGLASGAITSTGEALATLEGIGITEATADLSSAGESLATLVGGSIVAGSFSSGGASLLQVVSPRSRRGPKGTHRQVARKRVSPDDDELMNLLQYAISVTKRSSRPPQ